MWCKTTVPNHTYPGGIDNGQWMGSDRDTEWEASILCDCQNLYRGRATHLFAVGTGVEVSHRPKTDADPWNWDHLWCSECQEWKEMPDFVCPVHDTHGEKIVEMWPCADEDPKTCKHPEERLKGRFFHIGAMHAMIRRVLYDVSERFNETGDKRFDDASDLLDQVLSVLNR